MGFVSPLGPSFYTRSERRPAFVNEAGLQKVFLKERQKYFFTFKCPQFGPEPQKPISSVLLNDGGRTEGLTCFEPSFKIKSDIQNIQFLFNIYTNLHPRQQPKDNERGKKKANSEEKKTSQIQRMVKTSGMA